MYIFILSYMYMHIFIFKFLTDYSVPGMFISRGKSCKRSTTLHFSPFDWSLWVLFSVLGSVRASAS